MTAVPLRSSALQFSSFPARTVTKVPSSMLPRQTTLKAAGRVLLDLQWVGNEEHKTHGLPVRTNSPPIPGKLILWFEDGRLADEGPQPAELDDAGRLGPPLTPAKDVITKQSFVSQMKLDQSAKGNPFFHSHKIYKFFICQLCWWRKLTMIFN